MQGRGSPAGHKGKVGQGRAGMIPQKIQTLVGIQNLWALPRWVMGAPEGFIRRNGNTGGPWSEWNFKGWHR